MRRRKVQCLTWSALFLLAFVSSGGCGSRFATIEGVVAIDGKPANNGTVIFSGADNHSAAGTIGPDGSYLAENVPVGEVQVVIHQMMTMGGGPDRPGPLKGIEEPVATVARPVPIPKKYQSVQTSELTYTVTSGTNRFNISLSSK
jgi:hypothetical protein